ncbi:MAG: MerR family transcriptional regulator [Pseudomonadota bacterium]
MTYSAPCTNARTAAEIAGFTRHRLAAAIQRQAFHPERPARARVAREFTAADVVRLAAVNALSRMGLPLADADRAAAIITLPVKPDSALAVTPAGPQVRAEVVPAGALPLLARKGVIALDLNTLAARVLAALEARSGRALPTLNTPGAPE